MAGSTIPTIGAGTIVSYEPSASPGTWVELPNILNIGEVGSTGEFLDVTPLSKQEREFIAGMKTPPDKKLDFNDTPGLAAYNTFLTVEVDNNTQVQFKVLYPNNHQATFTVALNGRMMQPAEGNTQLKMGVYGKQSGGTGWAVL
jgi:hypothetical protein